MKKNLVPHKNPEVIRAITEADTLMAVGEWLESRERKVEGIAGPISRGFNITERDIADLKAGRMPGEAERPGRE